MIQVNRFGVSSRREFVSPQTQPAVVIEAIIIKRVVRVELLGINVGMYFMMSMSFTIFFIRVFPILVFIIIFQFRIDLRTLLRPIRQHDRTCPFRIISFLQALLIFLNKIQS